MNHEKWGFSDMLLRCLSFVPEIKCRNFKRRCYNQFLEVHAAFLNSFELVNELW